MEKFIKKNKKSVLLKIDQEIYSLTTIYATAYVFLDQAYIYLDKDSQGKINVWLYPKKVKEDLNILGMEFYNELINYAHFFSNLKVNAGIIKTLMQRALFSASPALVKDVSTEEIENLMNDLEEKDEQA